MILGRNFWPEVQYIINTNQHSVSKSIPYKMVTCVIHNLGIEGAIDGGDETETTASNVVASSS
jgi:hypothetical protein